MTPLTATEFMQVLAKHYEDKPDDEVISIGHWSTDTGSRFSTSVPSFYADVQTTVGDIRKMAEE